MFKRANMIYIIRYIK